MVARKSLQSRFLLYTHFSEEVLFICKRVNRHTLAKAKVGHSMSRDTHFHPVHFMFRTEPMLNIRTHVFARGRVRRAIRRSWSSLMLRVKSSTTAFN